MKCYKTPKAFAEKVCREKKQSCPREAWFLVEDAYLGWAIQNTAPRSHYIKRVIYCVDRNRFVEKVYGVWVECPSDRDRELLKQRRLRRWLERQRENPPSGHLCARNLEEDVQKDLNQFLVRARERCSDKEFNGRVLEETLALMRGWACFEMLDTEGDPLVKAKK
jgi:hypothetical protein